MNDIDRFKEAAAEATPPASTVMFEMIERIDSLEKAEQKAEARTLLAEVIENLQSALASLRDEAVAIVEENKAMKERIEQMEKHGQEPVAEFEDERVQKVYEMLCSTESPANPDEHWEGWIARKIVDALYLAPPAPAVPVGVTEFLRKLKNQTPEKPDHWNSCGQCERNSDQADDLLEMLAAAPTPPPDQRDEEIAELKRQVFSYESMVSDLDKAVKYLTGQFWLLTEDLLIRGRTISVADMETVLKSAPIPEALEKSHE